MEPEPLQAVIYTRLSSSTGVTDPSTSIERQEESCRQYAASKGWKVIYVERDDNVSGSDKGLRLDRPGLLRIRNRWDDFDVLLISKLDRLARNVLDFRSLTEEAMSHKVDLVSVGDSIDLTTANGKFFATILAAFGEMEAAAIAGRVRESVHKLRQSGRYAGGNLPYGYRSIPNPNGNGRTLEIDPDEAAEVQEMAVRLIDRGWTFYGVMRDLNARGVKPRRGKTWSVQAIRQMLTGDPIQGRVRHRGELITDSETGLPLPVWPAVLTADRVQKLRELDVKDKPIAGTRRRRESARLLSGLVQCGECGRPLYPKISGARREKEPPTAYACSARSNGNQCAGVSVSARRIEEYVSEEFLRRFGHREVVEIIETGEEVLKVAEYEQAIHDTLGAMGKDNADIDVLSERLKLLKSRKAEVSDQERQTVVRGTGVLYETAWTEAADDIQRRILLGLNIEALSVRKGVRGSTGPLRPERVNLRWKKMILRERAEPSDAGRVTIGMDEAADNTRRAMDAGTWPGVKLIIAGQSVEPVVDHAPTDSPLEGPPDG